MNNWKIQLLKPDPGDAEKLALFASNAFVEAYAGTMDTADIKAYLEKSFAIAEVQQQMLNDSNIFHIAWQREEIIGYTKLRTDRARPELKAYKAIELERIYTGRRHYRSGLGTMLFNHALNASETLGFQVLWLAVWQKNERAISFYKKMGMEIFGSQKFTVGTIINNDFVMKIKV